MTDPVAIYALVVGMAVVLIVAEILERRTGRVVPKEEGDPWHKKG